MIGTSLLQKLKNYFEVFGTYHTSTHSVNSLKLDLLESNSLEKVFKKSNPEIVINLCSINNRNSFCEKNKKLAMKINGLSLKPISKLCNFYNAFLVNFSTDYVFDGLKGDYTEKDAPNPINYYGKTKLIGEDNVISIAKNHCIIRTSMVFGKNQVKKTLPDWIIGDIKNNTSLKIINDQFMTPTLLDNLCEMTTEILQKKHEGIFHLAGITKTTRFEFATILLEKLNWKTNLIESASIHDFDFSKNMPPDSSLNSSKALNLLKNFPLNLDKSITKYLTQIKNDL